MLLSRVCLSVCTGSQRLLVVATYQRCLRMCLLPLIRPASDNWLPAAAAVAEMMISSIVSWPLPPAHSRSFLQTSTLHKDVLPLVHFCTHFLLFSSPMQAGPLSCRIDSIYSWLDGIKGMWVRLLVSYKLLDCVHESVTVWYYICDHMLQWLVHFVWLL